MDKDTRNLIERATQRMRELLEDDFAAQLDGTFDVLRTGEVKSEPGGHLNPLQVVQRNKIVAAIERKRAAGMNAADAVADYRREAAFTTLNRFVALKMLEARGLVQECITKGDQSVGYGEFHGLAPGVNLLPDGAGYRLYIESVFDELSTAVKVLFDRLDLASVLWPRRSTFEALLDVLNAAELSNVWGEDETIGWVYQYFNSGDERKQMREESQAPRNSRELAVRNQFFTPRYVVEFLVDNTLGRTWLEMHGDGSSLAQRCRYFVRSEEEPMRTRPKKDPRELRILDPACGSGHFLLYSFDLLLVMYEEAWHDAAPVASKLTGRTLCEDYPELAELRREAPRLIVEHNLYGVDIDPRAAQIAAFALWLRAQRAFKDWNIPASERPPLRRTHIVVAEPMPGDAERVEEFASRLDPPLLRDLFLKMVHEMRLAGELGALIRVETAISVQLDRAREEFEKAHAAWQATLPGFETPRLKGDFNLSGIDDDQFFQEAEDRILHALRKFAESAVGEESVKRKLFKDDATHGIALIDLLRMRFDVVLMNPPFGAASLGAKKEFEKGYPRTKNDIYAAFVERGIGLLRPHGVLGAITSRTGFFLSSFQKWREEIVLKEAPPVVFADLGHGVMDSAMVEAAAYCLNKGSGPCSMKTVFVRVVGAEDKASALLAAVYERERALGQQRFELHPSSFASVPGSPFAYWVSDRLRCLFEVLPRLEGERYTAKVGLQTSDDWRFVRTRWEVPPGSVDDTWFLFAKGGAFSPFYADVYLTVNWKMRGAEIATFCKSGSDRLASRPQNIEFYFRSGLTWPLRTTSGLSMRALPAGCIFGHKGPSAFVTNDSSGGLLAALAIANSRPFRLLLSLQLAAADAAARSYEVGLLQAMPIPNFADSDQGALVALAHRAWTSTRSLDTSNEVSHAFTLPALLQVEGFDLAIRARNWSERIRLLKADVRAIQAELDDRCLAFYDVDEADRHAVTEDFGPIAVELESSSETDEPDDGSDEGADDSGPTVEAQSLGSELAGWITGVAFGRFDVRLAIGARPIPGDPEPFDPLPVCSPGMLAGDEGLPLVRPPDGYPVAFPESGLLVDDPGHAQDMTSSVRAVFDVVFGVDADRWWSDVATLLDPKGHDIRTWLTGSFFEDHLKRYSKSRRKAPIIWQLGTASGLCSVWLYAHRLTGDSLFQLQNEIVGPKLAHEELKLTSLVQEAGANPLASQRKEVAAQESFVEELRGMLEEIKRVAPLWNPNLEDGVVLTMAPLWRLVPQHKAWQKELKSKWGELAAGKYDWAHLAMHLWPERVVPKCATDRSLAIAHGLEDVTWVEGADGKWKARETLVRSIEELIRERSSPAVKAALKDLLETPIASATGRARKRNRAPTTANGGR